MENKKKDNRNKMPMPKGPRFSFYWIYALVAIVLVFIVFFNAPTTSKEITQDRFFNEMLPEKEVDKVTIVKNDDKNIVEVFLTDAAKEKEKYKDGEGDGQWSQLTGGGADFRFEVYSGEKFEERLLAAQETYNYTGEETVAINVETRRSLLDQIGWLIPIVIIVLIWIFIMRRMSGGAGGPGGQIFNIGKSKATLFDQNTKVNVTFKDVAGLDEAKEEVMEVVDFLKKPKKYTALGGKIPKGVILVGPPGTGKTLMAKAVAGEAQVPFFSISGSDFVEMFVGVGASRVRDLFKQAREKAPCIIFIDEIDAIGRARGKGFMQGGNDERENTLNQLLVEMDGFGTDTGVIIIAATNRPDVLDSALMRPGRFDRQITIDKPDLVGREQIFNVHLKNIKLDPDVSPKKLAAQTPGFAGAEIANVCNEAALIAARRNKKQVEMQDFNDAVDRVIGGLEKKNKIISPEEKRVVAYHEAGHAICGWFLEYADPLVKVSIVPRGVAALGYAQYLPKEQYLYSTEQLMDGICMALGGRAAEDVTFGKITTGAQNDLERITRIAYSMVTIYGMNERVGNLSFHDPNNEYNFKKPYSEETAKIIDEEVKKLIDGAYERTKQLLHEKNEELEKVAQELLDKEIIYKDDLERLCGKRPFEHSGEEVLEKGDQILEEREKERQKELEEQDKRNAEQEKASGNGHPDSANDKEGDTRKTEEEAPDNNKSSGS